MNKPLPMIKAVGFDLDGTLYFQTPEMQEAVSQKAIKAAIAMTPILGSKNEKEKFLRGRQKATGSWSRVFLEIGIENPTEVLSRAIATANIPSLIKKDETLSKMIAALSKKYFLFIVSGSLRAVALKKLEKIGIDPRLFSFSLFGDDPNFISKTSPETFEHFLYKSKHAPEEHVYIGDNPHTDILIPKSLGMKTIIVGQVLKEADFSVRSIYGIKKLLL